MKEKILGYLVDVVSATECADSVKDSIIKTQRCTWLACLNPHSYVVSLNDPKFSSALQDADWLIPDGVGVVLASKMLGGSIRQRVTGPDFFFSLHEKLDCIGGARIFFLGGTCETLTKIKGRFKRDYPNIQWAGSYSPPFKADYSTEELDEMVAAINASDADVLWVGLTAPKQEKWIYDNKERLNVRFVGAVGAVFDFYAGTVRRSPPTFRKLGLEWLPRLLQQPRRLWRRMFISAPVFVWHVFQALLKGGKGRLL